MKSDACGEGVLNQNSVLHQRVRNISRRLEAHTIAFRPDALAWNWEVNVMTSSEGGKPPEFLSSHLADASPVEQIPSPLPKVVPLYRAGN